MGTIKLQLGGEPSQHICSKPIIIYNEAECLQTTFDTGFKHNDKPVIDIIQPSISHITNSRNDDSILDSVDTGFGSANKVVKECPKPQFKTHLFKENYLSEFKTEQEKERVRKNIGACGSSEIKQIVSHIISESTFVSKEEIVEMVEDLDFVKSIHQANAQYDIPDKLFQL